MTIENIKEYLPKDTNVKICDNIAFFPVPASTIKKVAVDLHQNKNLALLMITSTNV